MNASLDPLSRRLVARNLAIDRLTAEIVGTFAAQGIESIVLKGPALAAWLYPEEVRPYGDSDIMVAPGEWQRAVAVLERLGFSNYFEPMAHPRMESFASTAFLRDRAGGTPENVDLHCALHGCDADPREIWRALSASSDTQRIGGAQLRVPSKQALLLHVGLHAAHHIESKPLEDLRRGIGRAEETLWRDALELARNLEGLHTFASGLRLVPEGAELAQRLGIENEHSPLHELRHERIPMAEGIDALLSSELGLGQRAAMVREELFPKPEFMRWWSSLARRGRVGLAAAYLWRPIWLIAHAPHAFIARRRVRGRSSRR